MSDTRKAQNFLHGTALLTMATVTVRLLGAMYKIPLNGIIGEQGFGYFNTAYDIYNVLLMISIAGLPVAMSRMISQANSLGQYNQVHRIYVTARAMFLGLGVAGTFLMTVFCRELAVFLNQPDAWAAIGCLGPCVFLVCFMSTYRGFFQGLSDMVPTSMSQVIEAVVKLASGIPLAYFTYRFTHSIPLAAGGAILGVTAACLASSIYLFVTYRRNKVALPDSPDQARPYLDTVKGLLAIAIPITFGSAALQIFTMLETKIYMGQLLRLGYTQGEADTMRGIYAMAQTIFALPCALSTPMSVSLIPAITGHLTMCHEKAAKETEEASIRLTGLLSMPCTVGLAILARPVMAFLGLYQGSNLDLAGILMMILALSVIFNGIVTVTTAILQAHGMAVRAMGNMLVGGVLNLIAVYIITSNPHIATMGTSLGILLCYSSITAVNIFSMKKLLREPPEFTRNLLPATLASLIMGVGVFAALAALRALHFGVAIQTIVPIALGVVIYAVAAVKLKALTKEDCLLLPKGAKLAKFLKL